MTPNPTRRAFLGAGLAVAAGAGVGRLPSAVKELQRTRERLTLDVHDLSSGGGLPAFGTLRARSDPSAALRGELRDRRSGARAGTIAVSSVGAVRVHAIELVAGTIVAVGSGPDALAVSSGSGKYANARGTVTVRDAANAALALDIELEL